VQQKFLTEGGGRSGDKKDRKKGSYERGGEEAKVLPGRQRGGPFLEETKGQVVREKGDV